MQHPPLEDLALLLDHLKNARESLSQSEVIRLDLPPYVPNKHRQLDQWIERIQRQQERVTQPFTIMVLGEFNAGKSTLLNALLELPEDISLPTNYRVTTARVIRLAWSNENGPRAHLCRSGSKEPQQVSWEEALDIADASRKGNAPQYKDVEEVSFFLTHSDQADDRIRLYQILLPGANVLDMPGTGAAQHPEHSRITREYLTHTDMVIWVIGGEMPTSESLEDFRLARQAGIPIVTVFNDWGTLDAEEDAEMDYNPQEQEQALREYFPALFAQQISRYHICARKALEAQNPAFLAELTARGQEVQIDEKLYGLLDLREHLKTFLEEHISKKQAEASNLARDMVGKIAQAALGDLEDMEELRSIQLRSLDIDQSKWESGKERRAMLEFRLRRKIRQLAQEVAKTIVHYMIQQVEAFIEDEIRTTNIAIWLNLLNRKHHKEKIEERLRTRYLHMDEENNWLKQVLNCYIAECIDVILPEWMHYLQEDQLQLSSAFDKEKIYKSVQEPGDSLTNAAQQVAEGVITPVALGLMEIIFWILFHTTVSILLWYLSIAALLLVPTLKKSLNLTNKTQERAKANARGELEIQMGGITGRLLDTIMDGPYKELRSRFDKNYAAATEKYNEQEQALETWGEAIEEIKQAMQEARGAF